QPERHRPDPVLADSTGLFTDESRVSVGVKLDVERQVLETRDGGSPAIALPLRRLVHVPGTLLLRLRAFDPDLVREREDTVVDITQAPGGPLDEDVQVLAAVQG